MLNILIRAVLALILAGALSGGLTAYIQSFYPVGEPAAFIISYIIFLLLFIRPSHMSDAWEQMGDAMAQNQSRRKPLWDRTEDDSRNNIMGNDYITKPYAEWYSVDREDATGP